VWCVVLRDGLCVVCCVVLCCVLCVFLCGVCLACLCLSVYVSVSVLWGGYD